MSLSGDLAYLALVSVSTGVELRFNLLKRFRDHSTDILGRWVKPLTLWSAVLCFTAWLTLLNVTDLNGSLLLYRVGQGHWFVWFTIILVMTRWGWDDLPSGLAAAGLLGAVDELTWFGGYLSVYPARTLGLDSLAYVFLLFGFLGSYFLLSRNKSIKTIPGRQVLLCVIVAIGFHALWAMAGFPVSLGSTPDNSLTTAMIESLSWLMPGLALLL